MLRFSKRAFLEAYPNYGYRRSKGKEGDPDLAPDKDDGDAVLHLPIDTLRTQEFPVLHHPKDNPNGVIYLDHAGATLYGKSQLERCLSRLQANVFGNPHSKGPVASVTQQEVEEVRSMVLQHFNASGEEWTVVFTSGATAALKLAAEIFPWKKSKEQSGCLFYAHNSHTSVLGMREVVLHKGGTYSPLEPAVQYREEEQGEEEGSALPLTRLIAETLFRQQKDEHDQNKEADYSPTSTTDHLLALPAECNFDGRKLDFQLLKRFASQLRKLLPPQQRMRVLLDAAKQVSTSPLDLSVFEEGEVDMVCLSFYKMFGYPTGLGCLLVRSSLARECLEHEDQAHAAQIHTHRQTHRRYFGGGTVLAVTPHDPSHFVRRPEASERLVDGTANYLGIVSLKEGFQALQDLSGCDAGENRKGMEKVQAHTQALAQFCHDQLVAMKHWNGSNVCRMHSHNHRHIHTHTSSPSSSSIYGSIVTFTLLRASPTNEVVGYSEIEKLASLHGIQLRTGCFCNPGACQVALGLGDDDLKRHLEVGHVCWDDNDVVEGRATGAVRVSMGYMTTWEDVCGFLHFVDKYFVSKVAPMEIAGLTGKVGLNVQKFDESPAAATTDTRAKDPLHLGNILIYPIKSCAGMAVDAWPIGPTGLLFDREWALVDGQGQTLRLNRLPNMRFIRPYVDLEAQELVVSAPGMADLCLSLRLLPWPVGVEDGGGEREEVRLRDVSVCGEACQGVGYQAEVDAWFSSYLGRPCSLVRASPYKPRAAAHERRSSKEKKKQDKGEGEGDEDEEVGGERKPKSSGGKINFSNEAQFLVVSAASVEHLNGLIAQQLDLEYEFRYEGQPSDRCYVTLENFRPNLVVVGGVAHQEDLWEGIEVLGGGGGAEVMKAGIGLKVTGPCARCSMVNIDHQAPMGKEGGGGGGAGAGAGGGGGTKAPPASAPVLKTLASYRRDKSNIYFGQFLAFDDFTSGGDGDGNGGGPGGGDQWLRTGALVRARRRSEVGGSS